MIKFNNSWDKALENVFKDEKYLQLREFLKQEYSTKTIYPSMYDLYNCFRFTDLYSVKAVILGQDPYHEQGQAEGLSFSVPDGIEIPPSLKNIYKELQSDLGYTPSKSGSLKKWANEGVLLLNTVLTVRSGQANSHKDKGWEWFTDTVIKIISEERENVVFILWGANARSKKPLIDMTKHYVVESAHPSPLSCYNGFLGSKPFSKTNAYLKSKGIKEINWNLND